MEFYNTEKGVADYIKMADGYDGRELIAELRPNLKPGETVLELGMGPGKDLDLLAEHYTVTGSDFSNIFLDGYRADNPDADLLQLDAITIETDRHFDAIYSNKVLHHLSDTELAQSVDRQANMLSDDGLVLHSFWYGARVEEIAGMTFYYRDEKSLRDLFAEHFEIIAMNQYGEMEDDDSIYVIARTTKGA
jgi:cyclopropane fatty-acyl-phospholipid synthase-like methyltransferase